VSSTGPGPCCYRLCCRSTAAILNTSIPTGSGLILTTASAINDAGQISGTGLYNGRTRAFLLAPVKKALSAPTSMILR